MDTTTIHDIDSVEKLLKMTRDRLEKSMLDNVRPFREEWVRVEKFCFAAADALSIYDRSWRHSPACGY